MSASPGARRAGRGGLEASGLDERRAARGLDARRAPPRPSGHPSDPALLFCCDWGVKAYFDALYGREVQWDVPLLEGYAHEFLPIARRPRRISYFEVDNPTVAERLEAFAPEALLVHGYGCRTMWRAVRWAARRGVPALLSSDSHAGAGEALWKRPLKELLVGRFYARLAGALAVGDNNRAYHRRFGLPEERIFPGVLPVDGARLLASVPDRAAARAEVRAMLGIPAGALVALFCGNLTPWKRPVDFVEGVERAGAELWGVVVGDGPERARVEAAVAASRRSAATTPPPTCWSSPRSATRIRWW